MKDVELRNSNAPLSEVCLITYKLLKHQNKGSRGCFGAAPSSGLGQPAGVSLASSSWNTSPPGAGVSDKQFEQILTRSNDLRAPVTFPACRFEVVTSQFDSLNGKWTGWRAAEEIVVTLGTKREEEGLCKTKPETHYYFRKKNKQENKWLEISSKITVKWFSFLSLITSSCITVQVSSMMCLDWWFRAKNSVQKEQGGGTKETALRSLYSLENCKATWFSSVGDAGNNSPLIGKDVMIPLIPQASPRSPWVRSCESTG